MTDQDSRPSPFTLTVPGFPQAWQQAQATGLPRLPALATMVSRGDVSRRPPPPAGWHSRHAAWLSSLGILPDRMHGIALLEWLGLGGDAVEGGWVQAAFVHLEIGSHDTRVHPVAELDAAEAGQLAAALVAGLEFPGFDILPSPDPARFAGVFVHSAQPIDALCPLPAPGDPVDLRDVLPQGPAGPALRRLFTEAQMLLHDHPVNQARERRKQRLVNAVWLGGVAEFHGILAPSLPSVAAGEAFLQGVCRLHGTHALAVPRAFEPMAVQSPVLIDLGTAANDPRLVERWERDWFAPLVSAVGSGRMAAAVVQLGDVGITIDRSRLRRFWRRKPALAEVFQ